MTAFNPAGTTRSDLTDSVLDGVAKALRAARTSKAINSERAENAQPEPGLLAVLSVPSTSRKHTAHIIKFYEDRMRHCSCEGFTFNGYCRHTIALLDPNIQDVVTTHLAQASEIGRIVSRVAKGW